MRLAGGVMVRLLLFRCRLRTGAADIVFNAAVVRGRRPDVTSAVPSAGFGEAPPRPQEVYMGR